MSTIAQWLRNLGSTIAAFLGAIVHIVFNTWTHYDQVVDDVTHIYATWIAMKANVEREVSQIRKFKFDPKWKTRVINVPQAAQQIQDLKALVFDDFKGRVARLVEPVHELTLVLHQERAPDVEDPQGAVNAFSKAEVKLNHVVTMIHQVRDSFDEAADLVDLFRQLREQFEGLDALFLPQGNTKKTVDVSYRKRQSRKHGT